MGIMYLRWSKVMSQLPGELFVNGGIDIHKAGYSAGAVDALDELCSRLQYSCEEIPQHVWSKINDVLVEAAKLRDSQVKGIRPPAAKRS